MNRSISILQHFRSTRLLVAKLNRAPQASTQGRSRDYSHRVGILWIQLQHTTRSQAGMVIIALVYERVRICQHSPYLPGPKGRQAQ